MTAFHIIPELKSIAFEQRLTECGFTKLKMRRLAEDNIFVFLFFNMVCRIRSYSGVLPVPDVDGIDTTCVSA